MTKEPKSAPVEIDDIATVEKTYEVPHPSTDENVGIRVTLMSVNDKRMKGLKRQIQNANLQRQAKRKTIKAVEVEENEIAMASGAIVSWDWYDAVYKGEKPDCTPKTKAEILNAKSWIKDFVVEKLELESDFFTK